MIHKKNKITLEKIIGTDNQIRELYNILIKRNHNISNKSSTSLKEHIKFVKNHPYRSWYLIKTNSDYIGSAYLAKNNCVGINLVMNFDLFPIILKSLLKKYRPLREIKSVRPSYFYINIAPSNKEIEAELVKLNAPKIQSSFILTSS
jgi:hypothetical protein